MFGGGGQETIQLLMFLLVGVTGTFFWAWMIVDCATNEPNHGNIKVVWILVIIFTNWIGALLYYFFRRPQRIADLGS